MEIFEHLDKLITELQKAGRVTGFTIPRGDSGSNRDRTVETHYDIESLVAERVIDALCAIYGEYGNKIAKTKI